MNLRVRVCFLLARLKLHNPDCEHCNPHRPCWGEMKKRLEDLKNTAFTSITSNTTGVTERGMNVSWSVTDYGAAPHRYKDVVVTVAWEGKNISCYTVITEP